MLFVFPMMTREMHTAQLLFRVLFKGPRLTFENCNEYAVNVFRHHTSPALLFIFSEEHHRTILQAVFAIRYRTRLARRSMLCD
jgi:hypothetical protein